MMLRNLRIGARLALGFGAIVLLLELAALGATLFGQASRDRLATLIERAGAREALAADTRALLLEQQSVMRNVGLRAEVKDMQADEDRANALGRRYQEAIAGLATSDLGGDEKAIVAALRDVNARLETPFREAIARATSFQSEAAAQVITGEIDPIVQKALAQWSRLIDLEKEANHAAIRDARVVGDRVARAVYAIEALVLVLSALLAWTVTRSITLPIGEAVSVARRVASGDLSSNIEPRGRDEAAELLGALAEMNRGLAQIVVHIRSGAESIAVGVNQVAAGNQQLSSRTEEHASSLEETASTLEEFTTTVRQNSEHANQASELAGSASATAQAGGELVSRVVTTMQEVTASSKRISDIIGVIDGISFQTNILALNAAVEAARAGEHGRGFAVVASEVRNLAQRSAASAKEIRGLIEDSVGRVESGARLVEQAGRTTDELVASVKRVAGIMSEIAAASREQSAGIEQINRAIAQMDNVVQMNASLVEEASAAATSMAAQASSLAGATARFRLDEASAPSSAAPRESGDRAAPAHARIAAPSPAPHAGEPPQRVRAVLALGNGEWKEF